MENLFENMILIQILQLVTMNLWNLYLTITLQCKEHIKNAWPWTTNCLAYYGELGYAPDLIKSLVQYACHELTIGHFITVPCALSCIASSSLLVYFGDKFWLKERITFNKGANCIRDVYIYFLWSDCARVVLTATCFHSGFPVWCGLLLTLITRQLAW